MKSSRDQKRRGKTTADRKQSNQDNTKGHHKTLCEDLKGKLEDVANDWYCNRMTKNDNKTIINDLFCAIEMERNNDGYWKLSATTSTTRTSDEDDDDDDDDDEDNDDDDVRILSNNRG